MIELMSPTDSIFESGAEALVCPVDCNNYRWKVKEIPELGGWVIWRYRRMAWRLYAVPVFGTKEEAIQYAIAEGSDINIYDDTLTL